MKIRTYQKGPYQVINIEENIYLTSDITEVEDIIKRYLEKGSNKIAISFTNDSYFSTRTGAVLIKCWENILDYNGTLAFINVNSDIRDFLSVIDFERLINIYSSEDELESVEIMH